MTMYAVKGNREFAVNNETEKEQYLKSGFDIIDKKGNLIEAGKGKIVSYEVFEALTKENENLKAELSKATAKPKKE